MMNVMLGIAIGMVLSALVLVIVWPSERTQKRNDMQQ